MYTFTPTGGVITQGHHQYNYYPKPHRVVMKKNRSDANTILAKFVIDRNTFGK